MKLRSPFLVVGLISLSSSLASAATEPDLGSYCTHEAAFVNLLELSQSEGKVSCLDSSIQGARETMILANEAGTKLWVAEAKLEGDTPASLRSVKGVSKSTIFPQFCGSYLMGARLLPGSKNIALLYAHNVVRIVDPSKQKIVLNFDPRPEDVAYSCEGYIPNKDALRDSVTINTNTSTIDLTVNDWSQATQVCTDRPITDYERSYFPDYIEYMEETLADMRASGAHERYPDSYSRMSETLERRKKALETGILTECFDKPTRREVKIPFSGTP